jgi:hypothetical protein
MSIEWRVMVRINVVVPVEYVEVAMGGWIKREHSERRIGDDQKRYIYEAKIAPLLKEVRIKPHIFWIQCLPDSSFHPERPPMFDSVARQPFRPELRELYGYERLA